MKKNVIILLLLIQSISFSQNLLRYNIVNVSLYDEIVYSQRDKIKEHNISKIGTYKLDKTGNKILVKESLLDSSSNIISQFSNLNKRRINYSYLTKYPEKTILERSYGKYSHRKVYDFIFLDSNKKFINRKSVYIKNKLISSSEIFRQNNGKIDSIYFFTKQKKRPSSILYFSYKNGKLYETKLYEKGKLKRIQKYNCNPIGESIKKIQQTQECRSTGTDSNGNTIKVFVTTNDKGQEEKRKITFSKQTNKIIKHERFNFENLRTFYWEDLGSTKITINYNSKGKETFRENNFYDNENRIIKKEDFWKKKLESSITYSYNKKGLIESSISTNSKGKTVTNYYTYQ